MNELTIDTANLIEICRHNDITFVGLFGSFARGEASPESDMDLLVRFSKRKSLLDLIGIELELSEKLGTKVDLLTERSISPYLRERIMKNLKVIYNEER